MGAPATVIGPVAAGVGAAVAAIRAAYSYCRGDEDEEKEVKQNALSEYGSNNKADADSPTFFINSG